MAGGWCQNQKMRVRVVLVIVALALLGLFDQRDRPAVAYLLSMGEAPEALRAASEECVEGGVIQGALRNSGSGWHAIIDGGHQPVNIASVETGISSITVHFAQDGRSVQTFIAAPDERLARAGYTVGASVRLNDARIQLGRNSLLGSHRVSPLYVSTERYPMSNIWVYGVVKGDC